MQIQQILSEGQGLFLSSVTVRKDYGVKTGQTPHRALLIEDGSGKTIIKLWGPASSTPYAEGTVLTIQAVGSNGNISASEWKGKWSLNANSCEVIVSGAATAPPAHQSPPPAAHPQPAPQAPQNGFKAPSPPPASTQQSSGPLGSLSAEELATYQSAHLGRLYKILQPIAEGAGVSPDALFTACASMTGSASDWWFGKKWPGCGE